MSIVTDELGQLTCAPSKPKGDDGSNHHQPLQRAKGACQSGQQQLQLGLLACLGSKIPHKGCSLEPFDQQPSRADRACLQDILAVLDHTTRSCWAEAAWHLCKMLLLARMTAPIQSRNRQAMHPLPGNAPHYLVGREDGSHGD